VIQDMYACFVEIHQFCSLHVKCQIFRESLTSSSGICINFIYNGPAKKELPQGSHHNMIFE